MDLALLTALNEERRARRAAVLVTDLQSNAQRLVRADDIDSDALAGPIEERVRAGKSGSATVDGATYFINVQVPRVRLVVIGAVHVSQALAPMAAIAGIDTIIVDPRTAFATPERFPDVRIIAQWPDDALPGIGLDAFTGLAVLSHDPKIDDPALSAALRAKCFYVGALGSRKTHAARLGRLDKAGFGADDVGRIHAPIGLDIGAVSPAEIAASILAEVILALRKKPLRTSVGAAA